MKFLVRILFFLLIIFILNIIFYYISLDYKVFLENLKYDSIISNNTDTNTNTNTNLKIEELNSKIDDNIINNSISNDIDLINESEIVGINNDDGKIINTVLGKNYINILNKFEKFYDLDKIEVNTNLFEVTDEYPDYYYEYYSNDLILYFFTTKKYSEVYDIFDYLQDDLPISLNEVNNFGEKSFYINLNNEVNDKYIRIVISENGICYGLKIKSNQYEQVKNILLNNI